MDLLPPSHTEVDINEVIGTADLLNVNIDELSCFDE